jgi:hypothetical protein
MSRPITSRMHGMLDYPAGVVLIAAPWIFAFSDVGGAAVAVPIVLGVLIIAQSLITDYELSVANLLPMSAHLGVDLLGGIVLALSPVIFGFTDEGTNAWLPHVLAGVALILAAALTQPYRQTARAAEGRHRTHTA